jgi:hypothetical protein
MLSLTIITDTRPLSLTSTILQEADDAAAEEEEAAEEDEE